MNVYDFDETIYYPNSFADFFLWYAKKHPGLLVSYIPKVAWSAVLYKRGKIPAYLFLRRAFGLLGKIDDLDIQVERFWDENEHKISAWYLNQKKSDDLIISASPACIIGPIAKRLGVKYVATEYDVEQGVFVNNLMYGKEKSKYIIDNDFPVIDNFYSDSLSDTPIALCAEKAHLVTNKAQNVEDWPHLDSKTLEVVHRKINTGWTIHL
ncbi:MAG: hypothetical protein IJU77_04360 [Butyrivibrio sp.]|nr:hypothetical protein [Butyrivibrio sp.]